MLKRLLGERLHRATGLAWIAVALLAVGSVTLAIDRLALQHLKADAERTALAWAHQLAAAVPGVDRVFAGEPPSPQAIERLTALRGAGGMFRFKLYATDGRLRFVSDQLASGATTTYADHEESEHARAVARGERNIVELEHGDGVRRPAIYSEVYVPVRAGTRTVGVVEVYVDQADLAAVTASSFRRAATTAGAVLALVIGVAAWVTRWSHARHRRTQERLRYLARHDLLTGAVNHAAFAEQLSDACRGRPAGGSIAVLCVDLDRFSDVNDAHGHGVGDEVLRRVARRLHGVLGTGDRLARIAGDRFAVLQHDPDDRAGVAALAQRVIDRLAPPHRLPGVDGDVVVGASIGAAIHGADGDDADTLLHRAELALLQAKARGPARWAFYDAALDRTLFERRALVHELRQAVDRGSLQLHYQPLFGAAGGELRGYEALARWPHPTRGFVPPGTFIPLAEETGQIAALGRLVLRRACAEAARWPAPLTVAVNLSPAQFHAAGGIVAEVGAALAAAGLAPQRLELEITKSLLLGDTEQVLATLRELKGLGVRIAMDDFGTGYSSLAYLWRFPFDKLKIDRAFTQGLEQDPKVDAIVRSIVTLAHTLEIRVNAEGVETAGQRAALQRLGCDELQGFLLGRPQPAGRLAHEAGVQVGERAVETASS